MMVPAAPSVGVDIAYGRTPERVGPRCVQATNVLVPASDVDQVRSGTVEKPNIQFEILAAI